MARFGVIAELVLPEGQADLDELQISSTTRLLDETLARVSRAEFADRQGAHLFGWSGGHPQGASLFFMMDSPTPKDAEETAKSVTRTILDLCEPLHEWRMTECTVDLDAPPFPLEPDPFIDPIRSWAWTIEERASAIAFIHSEPGQYQIDWRRRLKASASHVKAFEYELFSVDGDSGEEAVAAAGALIVASPVVIDTLFICLNEFESSGRTVADAGNSELLAGLPFRFGHKYTPDFFRRMIVAAVTISGRLTADHWHGPSCIGEAIALKMILETAERILLDLDDFEVERRYTDFKEQAFEDLDHEWLYMPQLDGVEDDEVFQDRMGAHNLAFESWFDPGPTDDVGPHPHPYFLD
jgi:hypothetical protein